jgi:hypothetical protein
MTTGRPSLADRLLLAAESEQRKIDEAVAAERARCLWWVRAYAAYPKSNPAARAIESGEEIPNGR